MKDFKTKVAAGQVDAVSLTRSLNSVLARKSCVKTNLTFDFCLSLTALEKQLDPAER